MKRPEMIIFDYGHTLLYEPEHNRQNANKQISKYISKNPNNISFEEFDKNMITKGNLWRKLWHQVSFIWQLLMN